MFCFFLSENVRCWFVKAMAGNNTMPHRKLYFVRPVQYMLLANTPAVGVLVYYRAKLLVQSSFWLFHIIRLVRLNWYPVTVFRSSGLVDLVQVILSTVLTLVSCWTPIVFSLTAQLAFHGSIFLPSFQLHPFPYSICLALLGGLQDTVQPSWSSHYACYIEQTSCSVNHEIAHSLGSAEGSECTATKNIKQKTRKNSEELLIYGELENHAPRFDLSSVRHQLHTP